MVVPWRVRPMGPTVERTEVDDDNRLGPAAYADGRASPSRGHGELRVAGAESGLEPVPQASAAGRQGDVYVSRLPPASARRAAVSSFRFPAPNDRRDRRLQRFGGHGWNRFHTPSRSPATVPTARPRNEKLKLFLPTSCPNTAFRYTLSAVVSITLIFKHMEYTCNLEAGPLCPDRIGL